MKKIPYLQYGCGWSGVPDEWYNYDSSLTLLYEKIPIIGSFYTKNKTRFPKQVFYGNIAKRLPVESNSMKGIYCSHVLEHLSLEDCKNALKETYRILKVDGVFRLVTPDLNFLIQQYINDQNPDKGIRFMKKSYLGTEKPKSFIHSLFKHLSGSSHLWLWDFDSLKIELEKCGFINIRRAKFNDSIDPKFKEVEMKSRWISSLGIECSK